MSPAKILRFCGSIIFVLLFTLAGRAQVPATPHKVAVQLDGPTIFYLTEPLGPFSVEERAHGAEQRLLRIAEDPFFSESLLRVEHGSELSRLYYRDVSVGTASDADAAAQGLTRQQLAEVLLPRVVDAVTKYRLRKSPEEVTRSWLLLGLATLIAAALAFGLFRLHLHFVARVQATRDPLTRQLQERLGVSPERTVRLKLSTFKLLYVAALVLLALVYLQVAFALIPMTRGYALSVLGYLTDPLLTLWAKFLEHVGDFFFILVVIVLTHYLLKGLHRLLKEVGAGTITIPGVLPEWALSIYKIARIGIIGIAAVIIFPYIPGSSTEAFKGISLFAGALFTIGASGTSANLIGGVVLIFMGAYRKGDRIKIGDVVGDVDEITLLLTRVRTPKGEIVTLPNSTILSGYLVNYSTRAKEGRLVLSTTVTIGYDAPWRKVHELLLTAAQRTPDLLDEPKPWVFQKSLDDFYVSYEINAFTSKANDMPRIYSELHANIQDTFNEGGVEIMSPHYSSLRDGNTVTIPEEKRPKSYRAPRFDVRVERDEG